MNYCFECDKPATEDHHVIPKSMGGTRTIPLCGECHNKVHDGGWKRRDNHAQLTKEGFARAKSQGKLHGMANPKISLHGEKARELANAQIQKEKVDFAKSVSLYLIPMREMGLVYREIADYLNEMEVKTARGKKWYAKSVSNTLKTIDDILLNS
jgi:NAD-dependent SIR2 family protein deacetylase